MQTLVAPAPARAATPATPAAPAAGGSSVAAASMRRVATTAGLLHAALGDDHAFYARLVRRGFLQGAIEHARFALATVDELHPGDPTAGTDEARALAALLAARTIDPTSGSVQRLRAELAAARAAALATMSRPARARR